MDSIFTHLDCLGVSFFQVSDQAPSITDWIQAFGVILATFGLFVNFYYQRKTLSEQFKAREIEEERDRRAIMPWVEFDYEIDTASSVYNINFKCVEHGGKLLFILPVIEELSRYNIVMTSFKEGDNYHLAIPKEEVLSVSGQLGSDRKFIKIQYMDKESRPYEQYIHLANFGSLYQSDPMQYIHIRMLEEYEKRKAKSWLRFFKRRNAIQQ